MENMSTDKKTIHDRAYAFNRVSESAGEPDRFFLHHNEDVDKGHTNASVVIESLKISMALVFADGTKSDLSETEIERAANHLNRHARALNVVEIATITFEEDLHLDSLEDRISKISADWRTSHDDDFFFYPWIVAFFDEAIVTMENGRYYKYDLAEVDNVFAFDNRREVFRRFLDAEVEEAKTPNDIPIDLEEVLGNVAERSAILADAEVKLVHAYIHQQQVANIAALSESHEIITKELTSRSLTHESADNVLDDNEAEHLKNKKKNKKKDDKEE